MITLITGERIAPPCAFCKANEAVHFLPGEPFPYICGRCGAKSVQGVTWAKELYDNWPDPPDEKEEPMKQPNGGEHLLEHVSVPKAVLRKLIHMIEVAHGVAEKVVRTSDLDEYNDKILLRWSVHKEGAHTFLAIEWRTEQFEESGSVEL